MFEYLMSIFFSCSLSNQTRLHALPTDFIWIRENQRFHNTYTSDYQTRSNPSTRETTPDSGVSSHAETATRYGFGRHNTNGSRYVSRSGRDERRGHETHPSPARANRRAFDSLFSARRPSAFSFA